MIIIYLIVIFLLTVYSYALVDTNLTLINHPFWTVFRNLMVNLGYYQRSLSFLIYLILLIILFFFNNYWIKKGKNPLTPAFLTGLITLFSYPFLSHDFFNYLFDAKILTFYGKNPYQFTALDFPNDQWTRFMHWTHRTYPYGPIFLLITLIPSFLSFGKFFLSFFFFKVFWFIFYYLMILTLKKINEKKALFLATHPLIIIEGLINNHNDLIGLSLALIGIYFLIIKKRKIISFVFYLLSGGIKYITLPAIILFKNKQKNILVSFILTVLILIYLTFFKEIYSWYFLAIFIFAPFYFDFLKNWNLFFFGLLISYYPYLYFGGWDSVEKINQKHIIILIFFVLNIFILFIKNHYGKDLSKDKK